MSQNEERRPTSEVRGLALQLVDLLTSACDRIEIAGSVRRHSATAGDIELVAIPHIRQQPMDPVLWGDAQAVPVNALEERVHDRIADGTLRLRDVDVHRKDGTIEVGHRDGPSYKALKYAGFPVDLFITDAERWGCIYAIRTGPGNWNQRLVTDCQSIFRRVEDGRVLHLGKVVPTPEERDFFAALGQAWIEPAERRPELVRIESVIANRAELGFDLNASPLAKPHGPFQP